MKLQWVSEGCEEKEEGVAAAGAGGGQCRMAKSISIDWQKVHFAKEDAVERD